MLKFGLVLTVIYLHIYIYDEAMDHLSLKLNRLTDKLCRYESLKYFITKYLKEKLIPEGFWSLDPSTGNHDDEFLKKML